MDCRTGRSRPWLPLTLCSRFSRRVIFEGQEAMLRRPSVLQQNRGGSTMDNVVQLSVFLAKIDDYDGMNKVFKTYFPKGGPARTTVAVAALPGNSLVEINCIAAIVRK